MDEVIRTVKQGVVDQGSSADTRLHLRELPADRHRRPRRRPHGPALRRGAGPRRRPDRALRRQPEAAGTLEADRADDPLRPLDGRHAAAQQGLARGRPDRRRRAGERLRGRRQRQRRPHLPDGAEGARRGADREEDAGDAARRAGRRQRALPAPEPGRRRQGAHAREGPPRLGSRRPEDRRSRRHHLARRRRARHLGGQQPALQSVARQPRRAAHARQHLPDHRRQPRPSVRARATLRRSTSTSPRRR